MLAKGTWGRRKSWVRPRSVEDPNADGEKVSPIPGLRPLAGLLALGEVGDEGPGEEGEPDPADVDLGVVENGEGPEDEADDGDDQE